MRNHVTPVTSRLCPSSIRTRRDTPINCIYLDDGSQISINCHQRHQRGKGGHEEGTPSGCNSQIPTRMWAINQGHKRCSKQSNVIQQYHRDDPRRQLIISDEERQKRQLVVEVIPLFLNILTHGDRPFAHVWPQGSRIRGNAVHKARVFTRWLCQTSNCTSLERTAKTG